MRISLRSIISFFSLCFCDENIVITPQQTPLFIGSIEEQHSKKMSWLLTLPQAAGNYGKARQVLAEELRTAALPIPVNEAQRAGKSSPKDRDYPTTEGQDQVLLLGPIPHKE